MLLSSLLGAINGAITKYLGHHDIPALEIVFLRNLGGIILILLMLKHTPTKIDTSKLHLLFQRGLFGFIAMFLFFYTITIIPLGTAITLNKTSPIFVALLAFLVLKQKISVIARFAVVLGFLGVVFIFKPNSFEFGLPYMLGIIGGFFAAAAYVTIGKIKDIYDSRVIVLSFMTVGTLLPLVMFLLEPYLKLSFLKFVPITNPKIFIMIAFLAITATISQWALTKAYSSPNLTLIGTVSYSIIPFAIIFGVFLGDNLPDIWTFLGIIMIVIAGILAKR